MQYMSIALITSCFSATALTVHVGGLIVGLADVYSAALWLLLLYVNCIHVEPVSQLFCLNACLSSTNTSLMIRESDCGCDSEWIFHSTFPGISYNIMILH